MMSEACGETSSQTESSKRRVRARRVVRAKPAKECNDPAASSSTQVTGGSAYSGVHASAVGSAEEAMARLEELERKRSGSDPETATASDGEELSWRPSGKRKKRQERALDADLTTGTDTREELLRTAGESTKNCESVDERPDRPLTPPPAEIERPYLHSRSTNSVLREYSNVIGNLQRVERTTTIADPTPDIVVMDSVDSGDITVKVRSREGILRFNMKKSDTVAQLVNQFSSRLDVPAQHVSLWLGEQSLPLEKTIALTGLKLTDILDSTIASPTVGNSADNALVQGNMITLKVQDKRRCRSFEIGKAQTFQELLKKYCEAIGADPGSVTMTFDGDPLDLSQTPMDLDMDDDDVVDAALK